MRTVGAERLRVVEGDRQKNESWGMLRFIPSQSQTRNEGNKDTFSHESAQKADLAITIFQRILENVFPNVKESRKKDVGGGR